jgi:hypothetical protein
VLAVAVLAACGGGGGSSAPVPAGGAPSTIPSSTPVTPSFSASDAVAIPTPAPGAASVPVPLASDAGGAIASAALAASANVPADTTVESAYASTGDASLPALGARRAPRDDNGKHGIAYLRLRFSADVALPAAPSFSFTVPGTFATTSSYWLALYDPLRTAAGWQHGWEGPATVTATTAHGQPATTFAFASNGQPITFAANQTYWIALEAVAAGAPSPTPVPSSVPTNAPHDGKPSPTVASPSVVAFASASSAPVAVTFSQQGFSGAFTLHGDCTGIINTSGASPTFTLTPVAPGRCVVIGLGDRGATAVVHIGVVTAPETPQPRSSESPKPHESESPEPHQSASPTPVTSPSAAPSRSPEPVTSPSAKPSQSPVPGTGASASPAPSSSPNQA